MLSLNIFFTLLIFHSATQILSNEIILAKTENVETHGSISECLLRLTENHIPRNSLIFVVSSNNIHDPSLPLFNRYYFTVITRSFVEERWLVYPEAYLIFASNIDDFTRGLSQLSKDLSWSPKSKFIIFIADLKSVESIVIFTALLRELIYNVVIITRADNEELEVMTYYPYSGNSCGHNASDIRSFGSCSNLSKTSIFPNKIPDGLRNCTVVIAAREDVPFVMFNNSDYGKYLQIGAEQYVLNTIAEYEGIRLKYVFVDPDEGFGIILPNHTGTGLVGYLQRDEVNIIIGGLFLLRNRVEAFDFIIGYSYTVLSIYTPVLQERKWTRVYQQFSIWTWALIIISFFVTTMVVLITKTLTSGKCKDEFLLILKLWRYFYGQADVDLFKDRYLRRILIIWIVYAYSICAFYNTASYSLITAHVQSNIKIDPSNIAALPFKPCISGVLRTYYFHAYNETFPKGDDSLKCQETETAFENVASRNDLYTIDTDFAYALIGSQYEDDEGKSKFNKWDYPATLSISMYLTKGYPMTEKFQRYALDIYEKGLLQRQLSNVLSRKPKTVPSWKRKYEVICLEDFKIPYAILIIGWIISFIRFLIECKANRSLKKLF